MKKKIKNLYKKKFEAEKNGNKEEVEEIEKEIKVILRGEDEKEIKMDEVNEKDLEKMSERRKVKIKFFYKTRKKPFHRNMREIIQEDEYNDIDMAMALTSMLTHSLIEMKKEEKEVYKLLDIEVLTETVHDFLKGKLGSDDVLNIIEENWKDGLFTKLNVEEHGNE